MTKRKCKTKKAVAKRFSVTGTGMVLRSSQGRQHLLTKQSSKKKRELAAKIKLVNVRSIKVRKMIRGL